MEEILTFNEIAEQEDYVLCDPSISSLDCGRGWYYEDVYVAHSFSSLDIGALKSQNACLDAVISLFEKPNVLTAREVALQVEKARDLLSGNIRFLEKHNGDFKFAGRGERQRRLLEEIRETYHEFYMALRKSAFTPETPEKRAKYALLENIVLDVVKMTNAKVDSSLRYGDKRTKPKNVPDYHTDEKIVAAALYFATVEGKKGGILTRNGNMKRILESTLAYGGLEAAMDLIRQNRIRVYYMTDIGEARICFDSSRS